MNRSEGDEPVYGLQNVSYTAAYDMTASGMDEGEEWFGSGFQQAIASVTETNQSTRSIINSDYPDIVDTQYVRNIFIVLYTIVFCFCFFGNLAVVLVVTLHWKMRSITKFCLGNLAFANLCVGIFCVYQNLTIFLLEDSWIFGSFLCKMYHFTNSLSHTASILILVVICVERYLAILHPFKCRQILTMRRLWVVIVAVWIISAIICSPRLYYVNLTINPYPAADPDEPATTDIICTPQITLYDSHLADWMNFTLLFLLPLIIISILYTRVGLFLWKSSSILKHAKNPGGRACSPFNSNGSNGASRPVNSISTSQQASDYSSGRASHRSVSSTSRNNSTSNSSGNCGESSSSSSSGSGSNYWKTSGTRYASSYKLKHLGNRFRNGRKYTSSNNSKSNSLDTESPPYQKSPPATLKLVNEKCSHKNTNQCNTISPGQAILGLDECQYELHPKALPQVPLHNCYEDNVSCDMCLVLVENGIKEDSKSPSTIPNIQNLCPPQPKKNKKTKLNISDFDNKHSGSLPSLNSITVPSGSNPKHNKCVNINTNIITNLVICTSSQTSAEQTKSHRKLNVKNLNKNKVRQISWDKRLTRIFTTSTDNTYSGNTHFMKENKIDHATKPIGKVLRDKFNSNKNQNQFWKKIKKIKRQRRAQCTAANSEKSTQNFTSHEIVDRAFPTVNLNSPASAPDTIELNLTAVPRRQLQFHLETNAKRKRSGYFLSRFHHHHHVHGSIIGRREDYNCQCRTNSRGIEEFELDLVTSSVLSSRGDCDCDYYHSGSDTCLSQCTPQPTILTHTIRETSFVTGRYYPAGMCSSSNGVDSAINIPGLNPTTNNQNMNMSLPSVLTASSVSISVGSSGFNYGVPVSNSVSGCVNTNSSAVLGNCASGITKDSPLTKVPGATTLSRVRLVGQYNTKGKSSHLLGRSRFHKYRKSRREKFVEPRQAVVRMLITIVVTFAACNLPFHLRKLYQHFLPKSYFETDLSYLITPLTFLLMYMNCAINPILYAFMSKNFRSSFKDLVHCRFRRTLPNRRQGSSKTM